MHDAQHKFRIGDHAIPAHNAVGPTYVVVDFDESGNVTVAWRDAGKIHEWTTPGDMIEPA